MTNPAIYDLVASSDDVSWYKKTGTMCRSTLCMAEDACYLTQSTITVTSARTGNKVTFKYESMKEWRKVESWTFKSDCGLKLVVENM